jgi:polyribonucleotide nucleotidyltransferase
MIYDGTVVKTMEFGAFVNFFGPKDGLFTSPSWPPAGSRRSPTWSRKATR